MSLADLTRRDTNDITLDRFPDSLNIAGNQLPLAYKFEPNQPDDGATLTVPEPLLSSLTTAQLAWAIPGWRMDTLIALFRALPKEQRKHFVPVPDAAIRCLNEIGAAADLTAAVANWVTRESGVPMSAEQLLALPLPEYLRLNFRVVKLDGRLLREGRDLIALRRELRSAPSAVATTADGVHRAWDFGDLPSERVVERRGVKFTVYPALQPQGEGVIIAECGSPDEADAMHRRGALRLAMLTLPQQAKFVHKQFTDRRELVLMSQAVEIKRPLADCFVERVFQSCFFPLDASAPRTRAEFDALLDAGRSRIGEITERLLPRVIEIFQALRSVRQQMQALGGSGFADAIADLKAQLAALTPPDFIATTPDPWFESLPRYLRAMARRLERLPGNARRDAELMQTLAPFVRGARDLQGKAARHVELDKLRWMIEEFRVSLFAQELKTAIPVSAKRLTEQLQRAREEAAR